MDLARLERLVKISLVSNGVMLLLNLVLFYLLIVFVVQEPADIPGVNPVEYSIMSGEEEVDYRIELEAFFERTSDLLDRAARKHGANPGEFLPTQEELENAIESRTIPSNESQAVLQKLREGYDYFDLTWPIVVPQR